MRKFAWLLATALFPLTAMAADAPGPDWAFMTPDPNAPAPAGGGGGGAPAAQPAYQSGALKIVLTGKGDAVRPCNTCHTPSGMGQPESANIRGLNATYFARQMQDFKTGARGGPRSAAMAGFAKGMSDDGRLAVTVEAGGAAKTIEAEVVLVAVGRRPLSPGMGLEKIGVEVERGGFIKIDDSFQTTCRGVYAIGDVVRPPLLAHKASAEGIAAVEIMAGVRQPGFDLLAIAGCIYCEPEVATVGLSEAEARAQGIEVKVGKIPFRAVAKAVATNHVEGFVKIVAGKQYGEVLGCQIIGYRATEMISEVVLGRTLEATTAEFGKTVHPHPTLSEAIMEAALAAQDEAIIV